MRKLINFFFALTITLAFFFALFALSSAHASIALDNLRKTAVMVNGYRCSGSGSIVEGRSGKHYLLTNAHVCNCASYMGYVNATFEGGELVHARVVKKDWSKDLCAARVEEPRPALKLGINLLPFTEVNTRGYPTGRLTESHGRVKGDIRWGWEASIEEMGMCPQSSEKIYGLNDSLVGCSLTFTSTLTNLYGRPGSSGSAVVNDQGYLVGVLSSWHPGNEYDAGMVSFTDLNSFLSVL